MVVPTTTKPGQPPAVPGVTDPTLLRVLAAAGVTGAQGSDGADPPVVEERGSPKEVEVEVGGVKKRVAIDELTRLYNERDKVAAARKALDDSLAEQGDLQSVRALRERLQGLDVSRRQKILALLSGEGPEQDDEEQSSADDVEAEAFGDKLRARSPATNGISREEFEQVRQAVKALASFENHRLGQQRELSTSERVDAAMKQFPVFAEMTDPALLHFAKRSIMEQVLGSQDQPVESVVQAAASALQGFRKKAEADALEGTPVPRQTVIAAPKGGWRAQHMRDGSLRKAAEAALAQRR